jgi:hypothetical protein
MTTLILLAALAQDTQGDFWQVVDWFKVPPVAEPAPKPKPKPKPLFDITAEERRMLERIVEAEAGGEPYQGRVAVASVVLNRTLTGEFDSTIKGVIFAPYQFSPVGDGRYWEVTPGKATKQAVHAALMGRDPTKGATYFFAYNLVQPSWAQGMPHTARIGGHDFFAPSAAKVERERDALRPPEPKQPKPAQAATATVQAWVGILGKLAELDK